MFCRFAALSGDFVYLLHLKSALRCHKASMFAHIAELLRRSTALCRCVTYMFGDQTSLLHSLAEL
jgi:hypothetical protein